MSAFVQKMWAWFFIVLGTVYTLAAACWTSALFVWSRDAGFFGYRLWGTGLCRLMGIGVTIHGVQNWDPHTTYVVASNHSSIWDIATLACLPRQYAWLSKAEIGRVPLMGRVMKRMGCYFIRRDRSVRDLDVMKQVAADLKHGATVVLFPEGTRTRKGELQPMKKGAFRLAQAAGVPLLPVGISGTFPIAPPGILFSGRGHTVTVNIGKPLPIKPSQDLHDVIAEFEVALRALVQPFNTTGKKA